MKIFRTVLAAGAAAALLAACAKNGADQAHQEGAPTAEAGSPAASAPALDFAAIAAAAVADPRRPEADRANDERRKPERALEFMQVAPGASVIDIEAGGGWYTELLSHAVGAKGKVIMQNPASFLDFVGEDIEARLADGRLANVVQSLSNFDALEADDASADLVIWVQGPHELFFLPGENITLGDPAGSYAEIVRVLKPGGAFVAIDHAAVEGAPETTGNDLHRVDKKIVIEMARRAGLTLAGESDFLANPDDDRLTNVFDPAIRGRTDQFALRFVKAPK